MAQLCVKLVGVTVFVFLGNWTCSSQVIELNVCGKLTDRGTNLSLTGDFEPGLGLSNHSCSCVLAGNHMTVTMLNLKLHGTKGDNSPSLIVTSSQDYRSFSASNNNGYDSVLFEDTGTVLVVWTRAARGDVWRLNIHGLASFDILCSPYVSDLLDMTGTLSLEMPKQGRGTKEEPGGNAALVAGLFVGGLVAGVALLVGVAFGVRVVKTRLWQRTEGHEGARRSSGRINTAYDGMSTSRDQLEDNADGHSNHDRKLSLTTDIAWYSESVDGEYAPSTLSRAAKRGDRVPTMPVEFRSLSLFKATQSQEELSGEQLSTQPL